MQKKIEQFKKDFLKEVEEQNVAIFAGAGLSVASGHVHWKGLLKDFANEAGLDVEKERDLISAVQYYLNSNNNNRHSLNQKIIIMNDSTHRFERDGLFKKWGQFN